MVKGLARIKTIAKVRCLWDSFMIITFDDAHRISNLNAVVWFFFFFKRRISFPMISEEVSGKTEWFWKHLHVYWAEWKVKVWKCLRKSLLLINYLWQRERYRENKRVRYNLNFVFLDFEKKKKILGFSEEILTQKPSHHRLAFKRHNNEVNKLWALYWMGKWFWTYLKLQVQKFCKNIVIFCKD